LEGIITEMKLFLQTEFNSLFVWLISHG
jgi:hypothetical protein